MSVQIIIGFYAVISIMMMLFNLGFLQWERLRGWRLERRTAKMSSALQDEIAKNYGAPTEEHRRYLEGRLRFLAGMESFDLTMERLTREDRASSERYLSSISVVFEHVVPRCSRRDPLKRAYVATLARRWYRARPAAHSLLRSLGEDLRSAALFARQNAFEALVALGSPEDVARALVVLSEKEVIYGRRLLSEALLKYPGDPDGLADALLDDFDELSDPIRACVVNYLRLSGAGRRGGAEASVSDRYEFVKRLMNDSDADKDVRLACIRFFMSNSWVLALGSLVSLARDKDVARWEYAAVAARALSSYPNVRSVRTLKRCLRSPVYQVRFNAAKSLYDLGLSLETDLSDVMEGSDRYARDMLAYRWRLERGGDEPSSASEGGAL